MAQQKQQIIQPIENFIFNGIVNRLQQTFGCFVLFCNSENKILELKQKNPNVRYPYILASLNSVAFTSDFYNSNYLARRGIVIRYADSENALAKIKLMPATFDIKVEYYTDKNSGDNSVLFFMKRWMFARRLGYLKFNIKYGSSFACAVQMDESVSQPVKGQETDNSAFYLVEANLQINGFVSEPQILTDGVVNDFAASVRVGNNEQESTDMKKYSFWRAYDNG